MLATGVKLKNIQQIGDAIIAESATKNGLLSVNERIILVEGIQSEISIVEKLWPKANKYKESSRRASDGKDGFWVHETYEEALDVFKRNPGSLVKFDDHELEVIDYHEQGNELQYDLTGDFIDVSRVLEGVPEAFGSLHSGKMRNRRVRVVVNVSQVCNMQQKEINKRSERVIRLVNALENHNFPVELIAVDSCTCYHIENTIKKFNEPLVLEDVAIATHSDYLRRLHFRVSEHSETWYAGYGSPTTLRAHINTFRSEYNDELTVYIGNDMSMHCIDNVFDNLEKTLTEELQQIIPSICLIKAEPDGINVLEF